MSKLALLGGTPVFAEPLEWTSFWPAVDEATAKKVSELYLSRRWSSFHEAEPAFDKAFAEHHDARYGVFMVNGTVTLQCALSAYGIGPGDEVIVPAVTWCATAMAVHHAGAKPVFVDIAADTLCIDPMKIVAAITPSTKAIIPVHAFSSMADMDAIMAIAREHRLRVIEDCAHAHGSRWNGKSAGSIGDVGSFSFQQAKTMTSGEGGICITNDAEIADRLYRLKHIGYGRGQKQGRAQDGPPVGLSCYNFRATAFQALILHEQLKTLDERLERYRKAAAYLEGRLQQSTKIRFQTRPIQVQPHGCYVWVMIFDDLSYPDIPLAAIQKALTAEGLPAETTWAPVYQFILFNLQAQDYRIAQPCAVAEQLTSRILILNHAYLGLETNQLEKIAAAIEKVMSSADELRSR